MRPVNRWMVPGAVGMVILAAATVPHAFASTPDPSLPTVTAADLIAGVRTASVGALSGTLQLNSALGLPALPDRLAGATSGGAALLTGTHTMKLWVDGPDRQRLALLDDMAETDLVHNGTDLWTYERSANTVTHRRAAAAGRVRRWRLRPGRPHPAGGGRSECSRISTRPPRWPSPAPGGSPGGRRTSSR